MIPFRSIGLTVGSSSFFVAILLDVGAHAQMTGFVAKPLLQSTVERDENKDAVLLGITIAPGGSSGRHTHPGDCYGTVVEGAVELRVEGRDPRRVSAGGGLAQPSRCDS